MFELLKLGPFRCSVSAVLPRAANQWPLYRCSSSSYMPRLRPDIARGLGYGSHAWPAGHGLLSAPGGHLGWQQAGEAWGERALDWAYLVEPYG
jgi:hypothetical protein